VPGSSTGILTTNFLHNAIVRNGTIRNWDNFGIWFDWVTRVVTLESLNLQSNGFSGCTSANAATTVRNVESSFNGNTGISAGDDSLIESSKAYRNGGHGVVIRQGLVVDTVSTYNGENGFDTVQGGTLFSRCVAANNDVDGFDLSFGDTLLDCTSNRNGRYGVWASYRNVVRNNIFERNPQAGVRISGDGNRIENNHAIDNGVGIHVTSGTENFIVGNTCIGNDTNYYVVAGNVCQVITPGITTNLINGSSGGVAPGSTSPWINFGY
jgi:parallel beta-helix repeat protein